MENKPKGNHQPSQTSYVYCTSSMNASGMHLAATHSKACEGRWLPDGRSSAIRTLRQYVLKYRLLFLLLTYQGDCCSIWPCQRPPSRPSQWDQSHPDVTSETGCPPCNHGSRGPTGLEWVRELWVAGDCSYVGYRLADKLQVFTTYLWT